MKTFILLILLLAGGFAFWAFNDGGMPSMPFGKSESTPKESVTHTVVKGDTLHSISRKHHTTVASIQKLNNLSSNTILIGDKLTIQPGSQSSNPSTTTSEPKSNQTTNTEPKEKAEPVVQLKSLPKPKTVTRKNLPKSTVMESSKIAIDINARNQVYLKNSSGKFAPAGSIIYGSDADKNGNEIKTITYRDLKGKETTLPGSADPEAVIRLSLKKK